MRKPDDRKSQLVEKPLKVGSPDPTGTRTVTPGDLTNTVSLLGTVTKGPTGPAFRMSTLGARVEVSGADLLKSTTLARQKR
jgi:hypothetical protein